MKRALPFVLAAVALAMSSTLAYAANAIRVSGPSPYAGCTAGAGTGTLYTNAETEPYIAVNAANTQNLIATWQQDRWSNGGAHGGAAAFSTNGGTSWTETTLPFSDCAPGGVVGPDGQGFLRASDFWVSFGPDGTAYSSSLSFDLSDGRGGVANAYSNDGGATWHLPDNGQTIFFSPTNQTGPDKNSITANPVQAGVAYTVWDNLVLATDNPDDNPRTSSYNGDAFFSKTTDGGHTWSAAQDIFQTSQHHQTIGNIVVVDPRSGGNTLYDITSFITDPNAVANTNYQVAFVKSTDGGTTWSAPVSFATQFTKGVHDPNNGALLRVGDGIPTAAIDPSSGQLYVAWEDSSAFKSGNTKAGVNDDEIVVTTSTDGGMSWSTPTRASTFSGEPVFTPNIAVGANGRVGLSYYDSRFLTSTNTTTMPTDRWFVSSTNHGATFGKEKHVYGSFNILAAAYARGFFVGDYEGLAASGSTFAAAFGATNCNDTSCDAVPNGSVNSQDIFVTTGL